MKIFAIMVTCGDRSWLHQSTHGTAVFSDEGAAWRFTRNLVADGVSAVVVQIGESV